MLPLLLLSASPASAFCGTFVSSYDEPPQNAASEVAIVRQGSHTTLTVANSITGDTRDFAMVVPVPEVLPEDAIHVVDPTVFDRLRGYSDPREVSYTCDDFAVDTADSGSWYADTGAVDEDSGDVEVEAEYIVGEYDIKILSATESGALVTWLQSNGYNVPDASASLLGEYIAGGAYFFAAQVREDAAIASGQMLSPLQFGYDSEPFGLPIRIGTLNSPGEQDLRIYAVTDYDQGSVAIANYDEATVDHDCLYQPRDGEDFTAYYERQLEEAYAAQPGASWITEYAWGQGSCDPCTGVVPTPEDILTLGYQEDYHYGMYYFLTRLRMRYSPQSATQDLVLYATRMQDQTQMRFIQYDEALEDRFPICNVGWATDPGSCDTTDDGPSGDPDVAGEVPCGCATPGGPMEALPLVILVGIGSVTRRRRVFTGNA